MRMLPIVAVLLVTSLLTLPADHAAAQDDEVVAKGMVCATPHDFCDGGVPDALLTFTAVQQVSLPTTSPPQYEARSDKHGQFAIEAPAGDYDVNVSRAGFEPFTQRVTLQDGDMLRFQLSPLTVTVTGTLVSDDGAIDAGWALFYGEQGEYEVEADNGDFVANMLAGWYTIQAGASGFQETRDRRFIDGESSLTITLPSQPKRDATVSGHIVDQDGAPVAGAEVNAWSDGCYDCYHYADDGNDVEPASAPAEASQTDEDYAASIAYPGRPYYDRSANTRTNADGFYELNVYAGRVSLNAWKDGYAGTHASIHVASGDEATQDLTMRKFPDKTAHITGRVVDAVTGDPIRHVSVGVQQPEYGIWECSAPAGERNDYCAITVNADGSFEGRVTPGYSIINVYHEEWRACQETQHADGSFTRQCGPQYLGYVETTSLAADATTTLTLALQPRPGPDATASGYVVDGTTNKAIPNARISFNNQQNYGHAWASTDGDGSYKLRLRSGYHMVDVWAEGYLPWQGTLNLAAGETPFDVILTPGESGYGGGCCIAYAEAGMAMEDRAYGGDYDEGSDGHATMTSGSAAPPASDSSDDTAEDSVGTGTRNFGDQSTALAGGGGGGDGDFEDLGGGLGPYNPEDRQRAVAATDDGDNGIPGPGAGALTAALALAGAAAIAGRRAQRRR